MKINTQKLFYIISFIIICTICLQVHWNYKNYKSNKVLLLNEVQTVFDKALEIYFEQVSRETFIGIYSKDSLVKVEQLIERIKVDPFFKNKIRNSKNNLKDSVSVKAEVVEVNEISSIHVIKGRKALENIGGLEQFPRNISMSFPNDSIVYKTLDSILVKELNRRNVTLQYNLKHYKKDILYFTLLKSNQKLPFTIASNNSSFKDKERLDINFDYESTLLFKRMGSELLLSFLFSMAVISCLFFLLYIIKKQKKIDEIKNDFINNITHEFKTPITTIATALEGMSKFNPENDVIKNQKYIKMSFNQLYKLESMVEKILETATLNSNQLQLNKELFNLVSFIDTIVERFKDISTKAIYFQFEESDIEIYADALYLENVICNLLDNALKYGGDSIYVCCSVTVNGVSIEVIDNGNSISKSNEKAVFEKFYRIPKGNIHDVKGYGIGLYYAKKIVEKHNGSLELIQSENTNFRITLPYEFKN